MHRLGANVAATAAPLLLAVIVGHCFASPHRELPPEILAAILVDLVLWGAVACHYLASRIGGARETADPRTRQYGGNVIPLPTGLDSETADAVRRINRRLSSGGRQG